MAHCVNPRRSCANSLIVTLLLAGTILSTPVSAGEADAGADKSTELSFAFWNVENLFDTEDDPSNKGDDEYLPSEEWTLERYATKLDHLSEVIADVSPHVLGFSEVENREVIEDLIAQPRLEKLGYAIAHLDSPDKRGIDLAVIYRAPFQLLAGSPTQHELKMDRPTRGVLEVRLEAHGHPLTIFVNHWPSRGGDPEAKTHRNRSGALLRELATQRDGDVLMLGDFNDDPFDPSVLQYLGAVRSRNAVANRRNKVLFYNPSWNILGRTDMGTLYWNRDWVWNVFDQAIVNKAMLDPEGFSYAENSLDVYAPDKLRDKYRRPIRFRRSGKRWVEGYSDHFLIHGKLRLAPPADSR